MNQLPEKTSNFSEALELIDTLSLPEQKTWIEIIQKRIFLKRRGEIATSIAEAHEEYKAGKTRRVTVDKLMAELTS